MNTPEQTRRIVENFMCAIEVTELALHLGCARLRAQHPEVDEIQQVMREVGAAKEQAWRQIPP